MQCNAPCLYQVCEAGSNGSWCGRVRESCSALGRSLAIEVGVASHGTKAAANKKVLASASVALTTPFKVSPSNSNGSRKRWWKWWEHHKPGPNHSGFGSAFVQWTDLLQIKKSTCRNVSYPVFFFLSLFWWQPWCFATRHALVAAGLYFSVIS